MSIETWKAKFLPEMKDDMTTEEAVRHSLNKYRGVLPENLAEHGVEIDRSEEARQKMFLKNVNETNGKAILLTAASNCSLCVKFDSNCVNCPLYQVPRGYCLAMDSAYRETCKTQDPYPIITALEAAIEYVQTKETDPNDTVGSQ